MLRSLYNWLMKQAESRYAEVILAIISFAEASFFPLPPDVMLAPMVLAKRENAWRFAAICSIASVAGGFLGYFIGYSLQDFGLAILKFFGHSEGMESYRQWFGKWGFFVILAKGVTPIPYKITTIAAGLARFSLLQFFIASAITRTARFFVVAWLFRRYGPEISEVIEKRFYLVGTVVVVLIVLGFVGLKLLGHHH